MYDEKRHFKLLYQQAAGELSFNSHSFLDFHAWQREFRDRLKQALGLDKLESNLKGYLPEVYCVQNEDKEGYTLERWIIEVEPEVKLPFYLLRPHTNSENLPLVLTPHGHNRPGVYVSDGLTEDEIKSIEEGDRDIAVQAVQQGYLVIAPTARGFGETRFQEDKNNDKLTSCRTLLVQDLLVGRTPIGDRVYDISRLIDWAIATQNIDISRIAITGNSGGGTISLFAPACDERIKVAVPSSYFCTFAGSIGSIYHCECNYVPGILQLGEMYDVAGLIAPRPFCAICGKNDTIFPIEETKFAFLQLQKIYQAAGASENCRLFIGDGGHRYYKEPAWKFINSHFQRDFSARVEC